MTMVGCSTQKNTGNTRWWHSFNARYNTFFNGSQAFIDGNLEKEKGNKDNYTELIPLYAVGNKASRDIGKGQYDLTIEKCSKAIKQHSIKVKPAWNGSKQKTAKDREWLGRREYNPFLWKVWLLMGKSLRRGCRHLLIHESSIPDTTSAERSCQSMACQMLHGIRMDVRCRGCHPEHES